MPKTHPSLPLKYDWDLGENVKADMDQNLRLLGAVVQLSVKSRTADQPSSPSNGDRYIHNGDSSWSVGSADDVVARINNAWHAFTPKKGWRCYVEGEGATVVYDSGWGDAPLTESDLAREGGDIADLSASSSENDFVNGAQIDGEDIGPIESGTFTLDLKGADTAGNHTYEKQSGYYYRQGDAVTVDFEISIGVGDLDSNMSGSASLTGLPFDADKSNLSAINWAFFRSNSMPSDAVDVTGRISGGDILITTLREDGGSTNFGSSDFDDSSSSILLRGSATYRVA